MFFDFTVKIPVIKGKVFTHPGHGGNAGKTYVDYEYDRVYKPEKKYNVPKRTTIGKVCDDDPTMMYPNPNYLKYFPGEDLPELSSRSERSSCLKIGAYLVIERVLKDYHLVPIMKRIIGKDYGLFLDLCAYSIVEENNAAQYYPDYAYNHLLFTEDMKIYSDAKVSDFLNEVTEDQRVQFLNDWNAERDHREKIYISYDSTNRSCQAGDIDLAEIGHSKTGDDKPIINMSVAYDRTNREPLYYEEYPGSIVDVSQLQMMLDKAKGYGYRNVGFILDRGYFSESNIHFMDHNGYDFVIMCKGMKNLVNQLVLENKGTFEESRKTSIRAYQANGTTVKHKLFPSDKNERYFHIYYSASKYTAEREQLEMKIDRMARLLKKAEHSNYVLDSAYLHYFDPIYWHEGEEDQKFVSAVERTDVVDQEISLCGYFVLITSKKMSASEALTLYKSRDISEKLFRSDKSLLGYNSYRVHSDEALETKTFIEFVAMIIRNRIYTCLKDENEKQESRKNFMTVPAAIRELEKIEMIRTSDGEYRLDRAITKTQSIILKAFGIETAEVKERSKELRIQLSAIEKRSGNHGKGQNTKHR